MNNSISVHGKFSSANIEVVESDVLKSAEEYEKYLDELISKDKLYKYNEYENIIRQLGFHLTRRTINYYIEEELMDEMVIPEGKKAGYLTSKHIYKYICIAIIQNSLVLQLKDIKDILNYFGDAILRGFVISYLVNNNERKTQFKHFFQDQLQEKDDNYIENKLIMLMGLMIEITI